MPTFFGFETPEERGLREHNEGQEAGSQASVWQAFLQDALPDPIHSEEWKAGFENGVKNQPK